MRLSIDQRFTADRSAGRLRFHGFPALQPETVEPRPLRALQLDTEAGRVAAARVLMA